MAGNFGMVVMYNKEMDRCAIIKPTFDQRMQMIIEDDMPKIGDLWQFAVDEMHMKRHVDKIEASNNFDFNALLFMCTNALTLENTPKIYTLPYHLEHAYHNLKQICYIYSIFRAKRGVQLQMIDNEMFYQCMGAMSRLNVGPYEWLKIQEHLMKQKIDMYMYEGCNNIAALADNERRRRNAVIQEELDQATHEVTTQTGIEEHSPVKITKLDELACIAEEYFDCDPESAEVTAVGADEEITKERASNVVITSDREPSTASATSMPSVRWSQFVSNDVSDDFANLTDRWYTIGSFDWNTDQKVGDIIFKTKNNKDKLRNPILPLDIIYYSEVEPCDMPNLIPFKVHAYWRGDIEIKIQVNSNKFQIGQLLACFYYQPSQNLNIVDKLNIYSLSQMDHTIIQASASNDACIYIPYKNVYPFLATRIVPGLDTKESILNMGELYIMVMNRLTASANGPKKCKVSVLSRFVKSEFTGTAFGAYAANPEAGVSSLVSNAGPLLNGVMKLLDTGAPDANRDNPPNIRQPNTFMPTASHNWSSGTGIPDPVITLRIDPRGQTHHPPGCDADNLMTVNAIARRFGLIQQIEWLSETHDNGKRGRQLMKQWAHPGIMYKTGGDAAAQKYVITPVGILSNMFMQWRGSMEFKFQIVCSQFHTGRLMVGYIPGHHGDVTIKELKASPHVIFDLQEQREFTFEVPYISYRPWWPRQKSGNFEAANSDPPSTVYMLIYNELVAMESIPDRAYINVFMRGGDSFEVSVPVQPSISLSWHTHFVYPQSDRTNANDGYFPYYYGTWHSYANGDKFIARWGAASDQIAQFKELQKQLLPNQFLYYARDPNTPESKYPRVSDIEAVTQWYPEYAIIYQTGHGYAGLIPYDGINSVRNAAAKIYIDKKSLSDPEVLVGTFDKNRYPESNSTYSDGNPSWVGFVEERTPNVRRRPRSTDFGFEHVEPQGEEMNSSNMLSTTTGLAGSNNGQFFYGENFGDLKDYCRRYQMYGQIQLSNDPKIGINKCAFWFHCLPQGLIPAIGSPSNVNELFNRCREGPIPLIASLFRYYRGGLRFKIVFPVDLNAKVWIQHKPDRKYVSEGDRVIRLCHSIDTAQGVFNHGYGYYVQINNINPIIEFEVPFYNNTCYNFLQQPQIYDDGHKWAVSLGQIACGIEWDGKAEKLANNWISIYYALADDCSFSSWVGSGQYLLLDNNESAIPEAGDPEEYEEEIVWARSTLLTPSERRKDLTHEGFLNFSPISSMKNSVKDATKEVLSDSVSSVRDEITHVMDKIYTEIGSTVGAADKASIYAILGNIIHVAVNPTLATIATSVVNILVSLGILGITIVASAVNVVKQVFATLRGDSEATQPHTSSRIGSVVPESDDPKIKKEHDTAIAGWCSLVYNGVLSLFNVTIKKPKTWLQWQHVLTKDLADSTRGANQIFVFIRNTMDCIRRMIDYILGRTNKDYALLKVVETDPEILKDWCREILYLTDPATRRERQSDQNYINRVFDAQSFGQIILTDIGSEFKTDKNSAVISKLYDKITLLKDDLLERGDHPHVRKLPFTIYVQGEPGIGKSFLSTKVCGELLHAIKYKTQKGLKCTINPQSDYWDQCEHQPVLEIDDLWAVNTPGALEKQLITLFQVCSPIVLSPPKAAVEEKKMRYNPEIFYINSNKAFPVYNDVDKQAIWRRRDILVHVKLSNRSVPKCPHCSKSASIETCDPKWLADFHHLDFYVAKNVRDENTTYDGPYAFDGFMDLLKSRFIDNRKREHINFNNRVKDQELLSVIEEEEPEGILQKYQTLQERRYIEYSAIKARTLSNDIAELISNIKHKNESMYDFVSKKTWDITSKLPIKTHINFFKNVQPESDDGPAKSSFEQDKEMVTDPEHEAAFYAMHEESLSSELRSLVTEGTIREDEVKSVLDTMARLHDDGHTMNHWLEYHKFIIARMAAYNESRVDNIEKILDVVIKAAPRLCQKPFCHHHDIYSDDTLVVSQKIIANINDLDVDVSEPCLNRCILKSPVLRYMWYKRWLRMNPTYRLMYNRGDVAKFPAYLRLKDTREIIKPDNVIKHFLIYLKEKWQKSVSPAIRSLVWWVQGAWPKICQCLLGVAMMSAIAVPAYAVYNASKYAETEYEINKLATVAYAKEQGIPVENHPWFREGSMALGAQPLTTAATPSVPESAYGRADHKVMVKTAPSRPIAVKPQSSQQCDAVASRVETNTVFMRFYYNDNLMDNFRCIVLRSRQMLVLRHYLEIAKSRMGDIIRQSLVFDKDSDKRVNGCEFPVDFMNLDCTYYRGAIEGQAYESNFVILELPPSIPEFKDMTKFICPWNKWSSIGRTGTLIQGAKRKDDIPMDWCDHMPQFINANKASSQVIMTKCFKYPIHGRGMCGSVLLSDNLERPIVGIHVAGTEGGRGYGVAEPIFLEMILGIPVEEHRPQMDIAEPTLLPQEMSTEQLGTMLYNVGCVKPQDAQHQNGETAIKPSVIQGVFELRTEPNPLRKDDKRLPPSKFSPLELGCQKHGRPNLPINRKLVDAAYEHLREKVLTKCVPLRASVGIVSEQIAVCGLPGITEYNALSFTTSAGFPLSSIKPKDAKGKKWLFDLEETESGYKLKALHPKLRSLIDVTQEMRRRGVRPMTVFADCLKDTTLPKEKCRVLGKTRIFSISPTQYTIPFRRYMLDFMCAYRRARLNVNHAIGIDVNSHEWTDLGVRLQQKGKKIVTGDYSNYGPALNLELAEAACKIILDWYKQWCPDETKEDRKLRAMLLQELLCSYHLCGNFIYRVPCGIPSGSPITDILNSLVGNLYMYCCWQGVTNRPLIEFEKHCYEVVYGDDLALNISDEISEEFNTVTMEKWFAKHLIKFTDADKSDNIIPYRDISTATFLKHHFKQHPYRPMTLTAALDPVSVEGCPNWIKPNPRDTNIELTKQNCVMACNLAHGHGPEYYNIVRKKLQEALRAKQIYQPLPTWDELDMRNFDISRTKIPFDIDEWYITR